MLPAQCGAAAGAAPRAIGTLAVPLRPADARCATGRERAFVGEWLRRPSGSAAADRVFRAAAIRAVLVRALLQERRDALPKPCRRCTSS